jgi:3-hydroxybutyryl-CoA dehydrogenase
MGQDLVFKGIGVGGLGFLEYGIAQVAASDFYRRQAVYAEKVGEAAINRRDIALRHRTRNNRIREQELAAVLSDIESGMDLCVLKECDVIDKAAHEDREAQQRLFARMDATSSRETVFATNTTGLSISSLVSNLHRPEQLSGLPFFHSVPMMSFVKVVRTTATFQRVTEPAIDLEKSLGEFPIVVRNRTSSL